MRAGNDDAREFSTLSPRTLWSPGESAAASPATAGTEPPTTDKSDAAVGRELLRGLCEHATAKMGDASETVPEEFLEIAKLHKGKKLDRDPILLALVSASVGDVLPASLASSDLIVASVTNSMWEDAETRSRLDAVWEELQQKAGND